MRVAWGITGAGHYLHQSLDVIEKVLNEIDQLDLFLSAASEVVLKMYNCMDRLEELHSQYAETFKNIYYDKDQSPGYPICARFNLHHYDLLVLSPLTANSVGKMNNGIADTLITNIFAQMIKGNGLIYAVPCDFIAGEIETETPEGKMTKIHIDKFNSHNAQNLTKFPRSHDF